MLLVTVLVLAFVLTSVFVTRENDDDTKGVVGDGPMSTQIPSSTPSLAPSLAPSLDTSPTLEIVRSRDVVRCGVGGESLQNNLTVSADLVGYSLDWVSCCGD